MDSLLVGSQMSSDASSEESSVRKGVGYDETFGSGDESENFSPSSGRETSAQSPDGEDESYAEGSKEVGFISFLLIWLTPVLFFQALVRVKALQDRCVAKEGVVSRIRKHNATLMKEQGQYKDTIRTFSQEVKELKGKLEEADRPK